MTRAALPESAVGSAVLAVRERIARSCERARREPREITLVGVTKTVPVERVREALDAGVSHLGENRVQEAIPKMRELSDRAPTWHFIGHLQTNKARKAAELFDVIESVDSLRLARELEEGTEEIGRMLRVLVQVRIGDEDTKGGVSLSDLADFVRDVDTLAMVRVVGLMAIPPPRTDPRQSRADFRALRDAFESLRASRPEIVHLSMGMSDDFEIAVEEGATEVRVGRALFGSR
jgi:pyridoxal phosphate enzyme (YggS family)